MGPQKEKEHQSMQGLGSERPRGKEKNDQHFPSIGLDNPLRRWFGNPNKHDCYAAPGATIADLGCGPGFYTLPLARCVGHEGRVYAVDTNEKQIRIVERKAAKEGLSNIAVHATSAADLNFIPDGSVDFVLAEGLLCSMAPRDRDSAVSEMKRILKPGGKVFLESGVGLGSYLEDESWEEILSGFKVEERNQPPYKGDRVALVSLKN